MTPSPGTVDLATRHPSVSQVAQWFAYDHLPAGPLRDASIGCHKLAHDMLSRIDDGPELTAGLRKLLEAKDCFVRAALDGLEAERRDATAVERATTTATATAEAGLCQCCLILTARPTEAHPTNVYCGPCGSAPANSPEPCNGLHLAEVAVISPDGTRREVAGEVVELRDASAGEIDSGAGFTYRG